MNKLIYCAGSYRTQYGQYHISSCLNFHWNGDLILFRITFDLYYFNFMLDIQLYWSEAIESHIFFIVLETFLLDGWKLPWYNSFCLSREIHSITLTDYQLHWPGFLSNKSGRRSRIIGLTQWAGSNKNN